MGGPSALHTSCLQCYSWRSLRKLLLEFGKEVTDYDVQSAGTRTTKVSKLLESRPRDVSGKILNKSWEEVLQEEDDPHHHQAADEQHQPDWKRPPVGDGVHLTAAVHGDTQQGRLIVPFDIFAFH